MTDVSTRERAGSYDALETAKPGEPIFTLQGGDPLAPGAVMHWAALKRGEAMAARRREDAEAGLRKATNAEEVAWAMLDYQAHGAVVLADEQAARDAAADARPEIADLSAICDRIYNALAELSEAQEALAGVGGHAAAEAKLLDAAIVAGAAVKLVEPRRHLPRAGAA